MERLSLKNKLGLYVIAGLVMAAPFMIFGLTHLFSPEEALTISQLDWICSATSVVSGLFWLVRLKMAWINSMIQISVVALINLAQLLHAQHGGVATTQYSFQFLFSLSTLISIFLIAAYFRYPYVDRRDSIFFGVATRHSVNLVG